MHIYLHTVFFLHAHLCYDMLAPFKKKITTSFVNTGISLTVVNEGGLV